jgi:hypothetical protein
VSTPSVTCVVTAHNHERYVAEAIDSALAQDYPADLLDVIVVNDGSTDGTGAVLEARYGHEPRVSVIHQDNQGFVPASNRVIGAATGELIAFLDGDDAWPQDKLHRQVAILRARPEVGLVHGDMEIVDGDGALLHSSFFAYSRFRVQRGRVLGKLVCQNFVTSAALVVRASLRPAFHPIPEDLFYPDWYVSARVAERAEIDHVDGVVARYRMHGANMGNGATGRSLFEHMHKNVRVQRWMLGHLDLAREPLADLCEAAETMVARAARAALELELPAAQILPVSHDQRTAARTRAHAALEAFAAGRVDEAGRAWAAALALDPWNVVARDGLARAAARALDVQTRAAVVLAFADELVAAPELLAAYASAIDGAVDATLLIQAPVARAHAVGRELGHALAELGLDGPAAADLLLYPCDDPAALLAAPVRAVYTRHATTGALTALPRVDDADLDRLRELVA